MATAVKVSGYSRVSTEEQARGGISLEMQAERIKAYAASQGWRLVRIFEDAGHSGTTLERPALQKMLSRLDGIGVVLVWKVDRLSRKQRHLLALLEEQFEPRRVGFVSVTEPFDTTSPMGRAMLGMLGVFAQLERDMIAQRTRDALRHKQANGGHVGAPAFGYRIEGHSLVPVPEELAIVDEVRRLRKGGAKLRMIASCLADRNILTRRGRATWSPEAVRNLLSSPRYNRMLEAQRSAAPSRVEAPADAAPGPPVF